MRIATKVQVSESGCWLWTAAISPKGYGTVRWKDKKVRAHRLTYQLLEGPVPAGLEIDHLCRTRNCVNPAHMEPVTHAENCFRARVERCCRGHYYTERNTYYPPNGSRECRTCRYDRRHHIGYFITEVSYVAA